MIRLETCTGANVLPHLPALARLRAGRTTIVVAHRLSTVRDADLVVAMADGAAVEQGSHAELLARDGLYARLVSAQALAA